MLRRRLRVVTCAAVAVALVPGTVTAQDLRDRLEDAESEADAVRGELADATDAYETTWAAIEELRVEQGELARRADTLTAELAAATEALTDRAVVMFKHGQPRGGPFLLLAADGPDAAERAGVLAALQRADLGRAEEATALRGALDQTEGLLADRSARLAELEAELAVQRDALTADLERADAVTADLETRAARQRVIDRGEQQGVYACILDPSATQFRDTFGAPRSGGRSHKGTDVFGPMGEPALAFTDGVIQRHSSGGLGGIGLYLAGDDGNLYYYSHLQSIDAAGAVGRRVEAGELIAYNGDTGNARGGAPHVHFELKPGGGASVNPYPWLAAACF